MDYAERRPGAGLAALPAASSGGGQATDWMEGDGVTESDLPIAVRVEIREGVFHAEFTGTAPAGPGNVNCPLAVTRSAVLFVVRTLLAEDVPMNAGVQRAVRVSAPDGCLVSARWPSAVAAGNVETSQRITDVVFLALAGAGVPVPAQGQGTMNNVTLGGGGSGTGGVWTYYETIGGGQGAGPHGPGPSGVHVGMSTTRNTPVEVLELECPVRVARYELRRGSGGAGKWLGGDGVVREFEALASLEASLLTDRRRHAPRGAAGGGDGALGRDLLKDPAPPAQGARPRPPRGGVADQAPGGRGAGARCGGARRGARGAGGGGVRWWGVAVGGCRVGGGGGGVVGGGGGGGSANTFASTNSRNSSVSSWPCFTSWVMMSRARSGTTARL